VQGNEVAGIPYNRNKIIDILSGWLLVFGCWLSQFRKTSVTIIHWFFSFTAGFRKIAIST
jgi:hypothetical protein